MLAALAARDGLWAWFAVVHLGRDVLALPGGEDARVEVYDVAGSLADLVRVEDDVVVVVVEHEGDVKFLAYGEQIVHAPADVVVFQHQAVFDGLRQGGIIVAEAVEGGGFVAEDTAEVEDHDGVPVLLRRELEEREQLGVVVEVAEGVVDDGFAGGAELSELAWVRRQAVAEFGGDFACLRQSFGGERGELVAVFFVRGEGEHFAAESHEFDAVAVVPAEHLWDVADVGEAELFDEFLTSSRACRLFPIGAVFGRVRGFIGVAEWMAVFEDGGDATGSRAEDWRGGKAKVGV